MVLNINAHFRNPLTYANYYKWKFHFNTILMIHKLHGVVENDAPSGILPNVYMNLEFDR